MAPGSPTNDPPGFEPLSLDGWDVEIAFDGELAPLRHRCTATTLTCAASREHPAFQAPYVAAKTSDGSIAVFFVKSTNRPVQLITLLIDTDQRSALAACHGITGAREPRWTLAALRGAIGSRFSFADLTTFPLYQPSVRRVLVSPASERVGAAQQHGHTPLATEAVFDRRGHLSVWRDYGRAGTPGSETTATGRMLSLGPTSAVLPWTSSEQGGTVIFDRDEATYWGFSTGGPLAPNLALRTIRGRIDAWS